TSSATTWRATSEWHGLSSKGAQTLRVRARPRRACHTTFIALDTLTLFFHIAFMATVELTPEAAEQLEPLPKVLHPRVNRLPERLEHWPDVSGVKALCGDLAGWYRLRTGDYRLRFFVRGERIIVDKIGHRSEFYED